MERALTVRPKARRPVRGAVARRLAALAAVAVVGVTTTARALAQVPKADDRRGRVETESAGETQSRYVAIPFTVGPSGCTDRTRAYAVTMRIYNVLAQPVGIPILAAVSPAGGPVPGAGRPLSGLVLPCGQYFAVWNGRHLTTGVRMAPGVYVYDLVIDGQRVTRKITLGR